MEGELLNTDRKKGITENIIPSKTLTLSVDIP